MAKQKVRKAPTQYPFLAFHAVRVAQLAAALIVLSIMAYFIYNLVHDHWRIPKTFAIVCTIHPMVSRWESHPKD
jgi:cytochrome bd-type quinol oxidase subunit 1